MKSNIAKYQPLITEDQILEAASQIISRELYKREIFNSCEKVKVFLQCKLSRQEREIFSIILLDNQHRMIKYEELFQGTINAAPVYPREVVKMVMKSNAAAVIFSHNHP
jgi:DNA repair protein RadC